MLEYIVIFAAYFVVIFATSFFAMRITRTLSDYMLGGRKLSAPITALGVGASDMSGWLLLGLPGAVYLNGLNELWMPLGLIIGAYINWRFIAKRLRIYTQQLDDALTLPAYFDRRFHDVSGILRLTTGIVILLFFLSYTASGFVGGAVLFSSTFHLSYLSSLYISASLIMLYTAIGGFLAVNWVDFFQGILMFFALLIVPVLVYLQLHNQHSIILDLTHVAPQYMHMFSGMNVVAAISLLSWALGYFGQPHILVRFMAIRTPSELPKARLYGMSWMILSLLGAVCTGFVGRMFFMQKGVLLLNQETVFIELSKQLFNPWMAGIFLSAVLSAIMSTIAAQLLASSSALIEDIYHRFIRSNASQRELVITSKVSVIVLGVIAIFLARDPKSNVLQLVSYAWAGLGASFGPVIILSLFWERMTKLGAIAGIISGALVTLFWTQYAQPLGGWFAIYEIVPGFFAGLLATFLVSILSALPVQEIQEEFKRMLETSL